MVKHGETKHEFNCVHQVMNLFGAQAMLLLYSEPRGLRNAPLFEGNHLLVGFGALPEPEIH
jgi:hypothetical protein